MLTHLKIVTLCAISALLIIFSAAALAENWHYSIIVNAGSSGSRLHLFRYNTTDSLPIIEDMPLSNSNTHVALDSFAKKDTKTMASSEDPETEPPFLAIFDTAITALQHEGADPQTVPVSILGTAGMRVLPPHEQQAIYHALSDYLKQPPYSFTSVTAKTLSGEEEGIYDWLDVNYLAKNFNPSQPTLGCIDMGGASMEIVFATQDIQPAANENITTLTVNKQKYTLYSKSILGLGQDAARKKLGDAATSASCYPTGYSQAPLSPSIKGNFKFDTCKDLYDANILKQLLPQDDPAAIPHQQKFIGLGSIFYSFKFFVPEATTQQATQSPKEATLANNIKSTCALNWQDLKQQHPANNYLATSCANGVYVDELLFGTHGYQLQDAQLVTISDTLNQQPLDWTLGALLYQLTN